MIAGTIRILLRHDLALCATRGPRRSRWTLHWKRREWHKLVPVSFPTAGSG